MKTNCTFLFAISVVLLSSFNTARAQSAPLPSPSDSVVVDSRVFEKTEVEASVNVAQWRRHLETHLMPLIKKAAKKMKPGMYTVNVKFLVEKDGSISDVKALNDPGHGLATGAENVVKTGPKWIPGEQNGKKVRSYHTQPITFSIVE